MFHFSFLRIISIFHHLIIIIIYLGITFIFLYFLNSNLLFSIILKIINLLNFFFIIDLFLKLCLEDSQITLLFKQWPLKMDLSFFISVVNFYPIIMLIIFLILLFMQIIIIY